jgi:hypothetical protein
MSEFVELEPALELLRPVEVPAEPAPLTAPIADPEGELDPLEPTESV